MTVIWALIATFIKRVIICATKRVIYNGEFYYRILYWEQKRSTAIK